MWAAPTWLFVIAWLHRPAPGVIAKELMQAFGAGGTMVGLLSATYFYTYAALMIPAGLLTDAFGVRRVVTAGGAVMTAGTVAMAVAPSEVLLFAGRLAIGAGAAVMFVGALKVAATWFAPSRFGMLAALTATTGNVGSLLATAPLAWLVALTGWRGAFLVIAAGTLLGVVATWTIVREAHDPALDDSTSGSVLAGLMEVLRNRHTWPPFFAFFFLYAPAGNLLLWIVPYLRDIYGLTRTDAATYAAVTSLAILISGPLTGWVSDRFRRRRATYVALVALLLVTWIVFVATLGTLPLAGVAVLLFLMGVFGAAFVLVWPIGREVNPPRLAGVAVAVVNFGGFLGAAVTQGPLGALLDAGWEGVLAEGARVYPMEAYRAAFLVCTAFVLVSTVAGWLLKETAGRNVSTEAR